MPRAGHNLEELGQAVHEVDELGDEEEQQRLAEVAQDARHRQSHPRKVRERVAHKYLRAAAGVRHLS